MKVREVGERDSRGPNNRNALLDFQNKMRVLSFRAVVEIFLPVMIDPCSSVVHKCGSNGAFVRF